MLTKEQAASVKEQLLNQIKNLPEFQQNQIKNEIENMNEEDFEEFLINNNLMRNQDNSESIDTNSNESMKENCIFCKINSSEIPSYRLFENNIIKVVLEINPMTKGHLLIIPKVHENVSSINSKENKKYIEFTSFFINHLKEKLSSEKIELIMTEFFGHAVINLVPIYDNSDLNELSKNRSRASEEDLSSLQELLKVDEIVKYIQTNEKKLQTDNKPVEINEEIPSKVLTKEEFEEAEKEYISKLPKYPKRIP